MIKIIEHEISYKEEILIYEHSMSVKWSAKGCEVRVNKIQWKHNQGKIYMNGEHMVAGSQETKR